MGGRPSSRTVNDGGLASGLGAAEVFATPSTSIVRPAILADRTSTVLLGPAATNCQLSRASTISISASTASSRRSRQISRRRRIRISSRPCLDAVGNDSEVCLAGLSESRSGTSPSSTCLLGRSITAINRSTPATSLATWSARSAVCRASCSTTKVASRPICWETFSSNFTCYRGASRLSRPALSGETARCEG